MTPVDCLRYSRSEHKIVASTNRPQRPYGENRSSACNENSLGRKTELPIGNRTVSRELSPEMTTPRKFREIRRNSDRCPISQIQCSASYSALKTRINSHIGCASNPTSINRRRCESRWPRIDGPGLLMWRKDRSEKSEQQQNDGINKKLSPIVKKFHSTCC